MRLANSDNDCPAIVELKATARLKAAPERFPRPFDRVLVDYATVGKPESGEGSREQTAPALRFDLG